MKNSIILIVVGLMIFSCKKKNNDNETTDTSTSLKTKQQQVKETYANLAQAVFEDAYLTAIDLQTACQNFVDSPSDEGLQSAKDAWKLSREYYGQSEIFRFAEGPIDNADDGPEGLINAWPLDEAYIDYVQDASNSGIINNLVDFPVIDVQTLVTSNENGSEENISVGYHAIEFLLWGQDFYDNSAGQRPYTDFLKDGNGTAENQERRATYLIVCCDILVQALAQVKNEWATSGTNYRSEWLNLDNTLAFRKIFNSFKAMSGTELSGERIYTAYENQDQEDEHSCFSDNTHRDIALNSQGLSNIYTGEYTRKDGSIVSGYALEDLINDLNPTLNTAYLALRSETTSKIDLMYTPFDQAIILPNERPKVLDVVLSLQSEEVKVLEIAALFGIYF